MLLIKACHIKKYFGERLILEFDNLSVYTGDKIGIVGANGVGKSTLLNLLSGSLLPEEGEVVRYGSFSYAPQLSEQNEIGEISDQKLLKELKVSDKVSQKTISGGEETRLKLAKLFEHQGHILFLDEPTANLDMEGTDMLTKKLKRAETLLIISHDRALLDEVCSEIWEVSQGRVKQYPGNYSEYERLRKEEKERIKKEYEAYTGEKKRLEAVYLEKRRLAEASAKLPKGMTPKEARMYNFLCVSGRNYDGKQKNLYKVAESVKKRIEHMEVKEKPKEEPSIYLNFKLTNPPENKVIIEGRNIHFSYGGEPIFSSAAFSIPNHKKIALIGANGAGKTTLLNLIQEEYTRQEGKWNIRFVPKAVLGFMHQKLEHLELGKSVLQNALRDSIQTEETVRNILAGFLFRADEIKKKVEVLSGGERMKLALAKLLVSEANVLVLDEPTNYLDMPSIMTLQKRLKEYEGTVIFVSHDRRFINEVADELLIVENKKLIHFKGNLEQYEEEQRTRSDRQVKPDFAEKLRLELKLSRLISELASIGNSTAKEELESKYQEVLHKLKQFDEQVLNKN